MRLIYKFNVTSALLICCGVVPAFDLSHELVGEWFATVPGYPDRIEIKYAGRADVAGHTCEWKRTVGEVIEISCPGMEPLTAAQRQLRIEDPPYLTTTDGRKIPAGPGKFRPIKGEINVTFSPGDLSVENGEFKIDNRVSFVYYSHARINELHQAEAERQNRSKLKRWGPN